MDAFVEDLSDTEKWVQTERQAHKSWAKLTMQSPKAAAVLHLLASKIGERNAVVISHGTIAALLGCHTNTVRRAIEDLQEGNWIVVRKIGPTGTVNAYQFNDHVAWTEKREKLRFSEFSATVVVSDNE